MKATDRRRMSAWLVAGLILALVGCGDDDDWSRARLRILVTSDDGVAAEGIDAIVQALVADPRNEITVCAPDGNRSASGDMTGPSERCGDLSVTTAATASGYPATAINGCPADSVNYALASLYTQEAPPHVVVSGINRGQNVGKLYATQVSGTVGAAKTAARQGVPAVASSQGFPEEGSPFDYPAGVDAVLAWLENNRAALMAGSITPTDVDSLNIPSCSTGSIRGTIVALPLAENFEGALGTQNCESTLDDPLDDVEAFLNGFVTQSNVPLD